MSASPEKEFILSCLQSTNCSQSQNKCAEMISGPLNWDRIIKYLIPAQIASFFYYQLRDMDLCEYIPENIHRQFEKYYYKIGHQNILIFDQIDQLTRLLAEEHIDVILLKGAALQVDVWRNLSLREMADVDLLVQSTDLEKTESVLIKNGYLPIINWKSVEFYRQNHHHLVPYYNPNAAYRVPIEIHHNIYQPKFAIPLKMEDFWMSAHEVELNNSVHRVLSPENLLIHLCFKMALQRSFLGQIRYCLDISQIVAHFESNIIWDRILNTACQHRITNYIYYSLYFSNLILKANVPQTVLEQMRTHVTVKMLSHKIIHYLVNRDILLPYPEDTLIPTYKLRLVIRDILADSGISHKIGTIWNEVPGLRKLYVGSKRKFTS